MLKMISLVLVFRPCFRLTKKEMASFIVELDPKKPAHGVVQRLPGFVWTIVTAKDCAPVAPEIFR